jgi:hypothetical protein
MNREHFLIYLINEILQQTTPKDWARANQHYFPDYNFMNANNTPTTDAIEAYLVTHLGFTMLANNEIVICYKLT